jgi:hypothetical protein
VKRKRLTLLSKGPVGVEVPELPPDDYESVVKRFRLGIAEIQCGLELGRPISLGQLRHLRTRG